MKHKLWIILTLILSVTLMGAAQASTIFVPFAPNGAAGVAVQVATVAPYAAAPACASHDPTAYHGIWNEVDGCHFDHTHDGSPLAPEVVAIFGDHTQYTGQEVSYPWQTFSGAAPGYPVPPADSALFENVAKHTGYKFEFRDLGATYCTPMTGAIAAPNAWLIERHSKGNKHDFMSRVHSFWAAIRMCVKADNSTAYIYTGGWQDFGQRVSPVKGHVIPVPGNPSPVYSSSNRPYLFHSCTGHADCTGIATLEWNSTGRHIEGHPLLSFGFRSRSTQWLDATNGFNQADPPFRFICADAQGNYNPVGCIYTNTFSHLFRVDGIVDASLDLLDGVDDDRVNYEGYTDRWGNIVQGCTGMGLDCVPLKMVNVPVGVFDTKFPPQDTFRPDYNIYFDGQPSGWVGPEN